jgi:hypothetical protein
VSDGVGVYVKVAAVVAVVVAVVAVVGEPAVAWPDAAPCAQLPGCVCAACTGCEPSVIRSRRSAMMAARKAAAVIRGCR